MPYQDDSISVSQHTLLFSSSSVLSEPSSTAFLEPWMRTRVKRSIDVGALFRTELSIVANSQHFHQLCTLTAAHYTNGFSEKVECYAYMGMNINM